MSRFGESELSCDAAEALLEPYVDGELAADEVVRLRAHLEQCRSCGAQLQLAQDVRSTLRELPELAPPTALLERVRSAAAQELRPVAVHPSRATPLSAAKAAPRRWRPAAIRVALAAAVAALLAAVLLMRAPAPVSPPSAQVARATEQARFALAYVGRVGRHAGLALRDEVLERRVLLPAAVSAAHPLDPRLGPNLDITQRKGT
jgi:anti-sigma factor RsiW